MAKDIVVIGAGQAGFSVCAELRNLGHDGTITLIGEEPVPPYQRPPLSKAYLLGEMELERLLLRPRSFYEDQQITLRLGQPVLSIDRTARQVILSPEEALPYDQLVLATGARPVTLPAEIGGDLQHVLPMRSLADADRLAGLVEPGMTALVVGGGYIGLEAAAVLTKSGLSVTLVEAAGRILSRVASCATSDYFRDLHRTHGVDLRESVQLERLTGQNGAVSGAILSDGSTLQVDLVVIGIGIRPNQDLAAEAGLQIENGIKVDEYCRSSDPDILAVGDCASFPWNGTRIRLESVGNAIDQGRAAAATIMGQASPYQAKPWFWSDQYDSKLQIVGLSSGHDDVVRRPGDNGALSLWYYRGEELIAVDAMNDPRGYMVAKRLIESGQSPAKDAVANPQMPLKSLLQR
ncbi:NAD(P)/FAD-dependent oxidoreductase [Paracoccus seriniphilus]|uniref:3-phenylpropionate/trans-cinnamate dioxygenase ferredoxin reductase subunit n=1 Tax=Paracoccus seriniphilus TaxID=184748 RepID=A0A239PPS3_9RHOB|nr:FAD-dependent oxidoreductase [Paracoccus seriniphilus]WCR14683.1 FAD-dependent oxidoreductase [Paracoccus seriniphilus]SNT71922.1 3-phenylpropionate/trans-cinnamate dioxygenase ferredoxin reductase subunit [Paracoccus seriniphilus]